MKGTYKYPDGSQYNGEWSSTGQRHGYGQMTFPDGSQYYGYFENGLCEGSGVMIFSDNSSLKYVLGIGMCSTDVDFEEQIKQQELKPQKFVMMASISKAKCRDPDLLVNYATADPDPMNLQLDTTYEYEGDFRKGKFNGHGVFLRCDGMKYEGQYQDGKICGLGMVTFSDGTQGLPRNEGYFEGSKLIRREKCPAEIRKAHQAADKARSQHA